VTGRIKSLKSSSDSIGNGTCDLPVCSAVPQPTAPPRTPIYNLVNKCNSIKTLDSKQGDP
jgi:hypothetical protein